MGLLTNRDIVLGTVYRFQQGSGPETRAGSDYLIKTSPNNILLMKLKPNTSQVIDLIIVVLFLVLLCSFFFYRNTDATTEVSVENSWQADPKPIDPKISSNLPQYKYQALTDSIATIRGLKNGDIYCSIPGITTDLQFIGTSSNYSCDTCSLKWYKQNIAKSDLIPRQNYIELPGWKLDTLIGEQYYDQEGKFYVEHGQGYVRASMIDKTEKRKSGSVYNQIRIVDVPVKFRYNHLKHIIMIPVSQQATDILKIIFAVIALVWIVYSMYLILTFIKFIIDLSMGRSFTDTNVWRLKIIAISLVAYPIAILLLNYLMRLVFHSYFTGAPDVIMNSDIWSSNLKILAMGVVFLLLFRAFRQGKLLQEEQDLTV
jgi:hypothetical protein